MAPVMPIVSVIMSRPNPWKPLPPGGLVGYLKNLQI